MQLQLVDHKPSLSNINQTNNRLISAAGKRSKPSENMRFLSQSQQQPEPLTTPQYQVWNASICSPPDSRRRRSSARTKRQRAAQTKKRINFLFDDPTTGKMRREHLHVAGDLTDADHHEAERTALFRPSSPPSTIFSVDSESSADSQLRIAGTQRRWAGNNPWHAPKSPWHAPVTEYSLPPQTFVAGFQRNRCRTYSPTLDILCTQYRMDRRESLFLLCTIPHQTHTHAHTYRPHMHCVRCI